MTIEVSGQNSANYSYNYTGEVQQQEQTQTDIFGSLEKWIDGHTENVEDYISDINFLNEKTEQLADYKKRAEAIKDETKKNEIFDLIASYETRLQTYAAQEEQKYLLKQEEIGTTFDFMEGNDASVEEQYNQQLTKIAQGEFDSHKVLDDDGEITREEYIATELYGAEFATQDAQKEAIAYAWTMFDIIDQKMGNSDSNGTLSVKEFESFYKNLDRYQGLDENGQMVMDDVCELDGIIDIAAADFLVDYIDTADYSNIEEMKNSEQIEVFRKILFS